MSGRSNFHAAVYSLMVLAGPCGGSLIITSSDPPPLATSEPASAGNSKVVGVDLSQDGAPDVWFVGTGDGMALVLASGHRVLVRTIQPVTALGPAGRLESGFALSAGPIGQGYRWSRGQVGGDDAFLREHGLPFNSSVARLDFDGDTGSVQGWRRSSGYIGLELIFEESIHYGWIHVDNSPVVTEWGGYIDAWAYESEPRRQILSGTVPEPSTGLLMAVAIGMAAACRLRPCYHDQK